MEVLCARDARHLQQLRGLLARAIRCVVHAAGADRTRAREIIENQSGPPASRNGCATAAGITRHVDGGESGRLGFWTLPAGYALGAQRTATTALADDDACLVVNFGPRSDGTYIEARESRDVQHQFGVLLGDQWQQPINAQQPITIPLVVSYDGATAADHTAIPASVTIAVGESAAGFSMRAIPDQMIETGERLRIDFGALPAGVRKGAWGPYEVPARW